MNPKAMPPLTVTPSAHQVPSPGTASAIPGRYALARGVLHAGAYGLVKGRWRRPLAAAGLPVAVTAGGGRPVAGVWPRMAAGRHVKLFYGHPRSAE